MATVTGGPYPNPTSASAYVSIDTMCKQVRVRMEYIDTNDKRHYTPWVLRLPEHPV